MHEHRYPGRTLSALAILLATAACGSGGGGTSTSLTDTIPPQAGQVRDGTGSDIDTQSSTSQQSANWSGFVDDSGVIAGYEWAIGTTAGGTELQTWTPVAGATSASTTGLTLELGQTYYCSVRAYDESGNVSVPAASDGVTIEVSSGSGGGDDPPAGSSQAASLTQFGITWTFAEAETVGNFANGDWWVVGPIDIVGISPGTQVIGSRTVHGSMLNPTQTQIENAYHGYDSTLFGPFAGNTYKPELNVAIGVAQSSPLHLDSSNSLISCISWTDAAAPASGSFSQLKTCAVLTVLSEVPPAGAFRPSYAGNDKSIRWRETDLDYTALGTLSAVAGMPDFNTTVANFERPWLDHCSGWTSRYMHPIDNMPDYGRDFTSLFGTGSLMLQLALSNEQKRDLAVRLVQIGIDFWGNVQNGGAWSGVGGQCSGRKFPILLAGRLLGDAQMLALGTSHPSGYFGPGHPNNRSQFGEDCQTFFVEQTSPGVYNWGFGDYNVSHAGLAEWGNSHTQYPSNDNSDWNHDPYRRCCTGNAWVGQTLAAYVMGLDTLWNHPAYFEFMDRFMDFESGWTRAWEPWQGDMWDQYRNNF